ncbi:recombinase family protein [Ruminiclostridium cellulolyticum]|uniref:Resolvase domain protein n=1 Tax=Ruminiclostridium cellulolyticum (strain ATCC 35319 / DSM 5812 / JCM 6584 / H10) TaxID=394503 RepID=B8I604_RUMCH|nr:recombinase family protein [Ruminiclostridium cellulolyticum]ACL76769.1 Resolvase domain protein [Ruminiclostridium cellulolyticum H10]
MIAIYTRQSVDKKDSISIESQIGFCMKEISSENYKIYTDKGYSGSNINRPAFEEMIRDIKIGIIKKVVVYKLDRISRSLLDFAHIIECFDKYKVEFISQTEKFDTSTSMGRAMLSIVMVFAQLERETIQQRVKDNYYQRGKAGLYLGGIAPYGYNKVQTFLNGKKTYMFGVDKEKCEIVRHIYSMYAEKSKSLGVIARYLNIKKLKTNKGYNWTPTTVGRLIRNPVFVKANADVYVYLKNKGAIINSDINDFIGENGCYVYGERKTKTTSKFTDLTNNFVTIAPHKGIISSELWLKCQYRADENRAIKNSGKGKNSWLSGLMKCGYCGYAATVVNSRGLIYINCGGRKNGFCFERKRVIYLRDIEKIAEVKLLEKIKSLKNEFYVEISSNSKEVNDLKIKLAKVEENINKLIDRMLTLNETAGSYVNERINELDNKKKILKNKINKISIEKSSQRIKREDLSEYLKNWDNYNLEQKKSVAKALIEKVVITDEEIEIVFKI